MIAIPYLEQDVVFYLFTAECLIATIVLIPPFHLRNKGYTIQKKD
jgi:hypothetical protein